MSFAVETSDVADGEIEAAYLRISARNPEFAGRWLEGLLRALEKLDQFPFSHPRVEESEIFGREVRRMLYRNGQITYRILFTVVDADGDGELDTIRVLHIRHGALRPFGQAATEVEQE